MDKRRVAPKRRVAFTLILLASLSACSRKYEPVLDVSEAAVNGPDGSFELNVYRPGGCWWSLGLHGAGDDAVSVSFSPLAPCDLLYLGRAEVHTLADGSRYATVMDAGGVLVDTSDSWYQRNDESRIPLQISEERIFPNAAIFGYSPPPLEPFYVSLIGGGLHEQVAKRVRDPQPDRHRFHIAFTVDGAPHSIDVEFRLRAEGHWTAGVPGMP